MDTLQFETEMVPVRTLALPELLDCYLHSRNNDPYKNPLDPRDENHTKRAFALLGEFACDLLGNPADSSHIDAPLLEKFKIFLVKQTGRGGQLFSRSYCNAVLKYSKTVFFWALTQEPPIITEARALALSKVQYLKPSPKIRENKPRKDAPVEDFEAIFPLLRPVVSDMFRLQLLHAMRTGEVCDVRPAYFVFDWDKYGNWLYQPHAHKTAGRGKDRTFVFCKASQEIVKKYMNDSADPSEPIFRNLKNHPFSVCVYDSLIRKTIAEHGLKKVVPYQARHTTATRIEEEFDIKHAQALLGHSSEEMTRRYIHNDEKKISRIAAKRNRETEFSAPPTDSDGFPVILRFRKGD